MHSNTMSQTMSEELGAVELNDAFPPKCERVLPVDGVTGEKVLCGVSVGKHDEDEIPPSRGAFDGETGETSEDAGELQRRLAIEVDHQVGKSVPVARGFPVVQGQTRCKSEEDDGYCSRSSLDSPVQISQSDSEANDHEAFASKTIPVAAKGKAPKQVVWNADAVNQVPAFSSSTVSGSTDIFSAGPHSSGRQKVLVVSKAANVKYILPTTGALHTPSSVASTTSALSANPAPMTEDGHSVLNLLNLKILKPDSSRIRPDLTTVRGTAAKDGPTLSSIPTGLSISNDRVTVQSSRRKAVGDAVEVSGQGLGNSEHSDVRVISTLCDLLSKTASGNTNPLSKAVISETVEVLQKGDGVIISDSDYPQVDGLTLATMGFEQETDVSRASGGISTEPFSSEASASIGSSITGIITPHIAACHSQVMLEAESVSSFRSGVVLSSANGRGIDSGTVFQTPGSRDLRITGKPCISSSAAAAAAESGHARLTTAGQSTSAKSGTYQLMNHSNQDVTVILLPQNSVQSITKKSTTSDTTNCKQVLLRTGHGQLFKAISVNSESFKTVSSPKATEKLFQGNGDRTKLVLNAAVRGAAVGTSYDGGTESLNCRDSTVINKTSNGVVLAGSRPAVDPANSGTQLLNPERRLLTSATRPSANIGHFASLTLPCLQVAAGPTEKPPASTSLATTPVAAKSRNQKAEAIGVRVKAAESSSRSHVLRRSVPPARKPCHSMTSLHPLIDHDYCEFSAFCADVQSSIISLTESSIRPERRYIKKNRASKAKAMRVSRCASETGCTKSRPKRKYCKRKRIADGGTSKKYGAPNGKLKGNCKVSAAKRTSGAIKNGAQLIDNKNYVKIPGYYQDEYVYYATKRLPGRPRNRAEAASKAAETAVAKQPASGISIFDWYKEMAQTDKTTRFGSDCNVRGSNSLEENGSSKDRTPVNESDVADLVMDMLPTGDLARPISDEMKYMSTSIVESLLSNSYDLSALGSELAVDGNSDMAEEVRMMLSSMGEAELKLLESHLEDEKINAEMQADGLDINSYLGDYVAQENCMSQSAAAANFLDVDYINAGDLLSADITNMNIILNDLKASNHHHQRAGEEGSTAKLETSVISSLFDKGINSCDNIMTGVLDIAFGKTGELCKLQNDAEKISNAEILPGSSALSESTRRNAALALSETSPPELTNINMFWNDLPGLLIDGKEFVRLVDIHKQIMPAKDTGILKKRCHMMGLHITSCSELQRDFLIRYMNAAKSKSTVIIAKDAAIMLIGFYVNPKSRTRGSDDLELDFLTPTSKQTKLASKRQLPGKPKVKDLPSPTSDLLPSTGFSPDRNPVATSTNKNHSAHLLLKHVTESCTGAVVTGADVKRSARLLHKHISYSHMVHGGVEEGEKADKSERTTHGKPSPNHVSSVGVVAGAKASTALGAEQEELENLVREQKRRRLSLEEKLRLKLLRNSRRSYVSRPKNPTDLGLRSTRKRMAKRTKRTRRLLAWKRNQAAQKGSPGDLHTLEHCYAALPAHSANPSKNRNYAEQQNSHARITRNGTQGMGYPEIVAPTASASKTGAVESNSVGVIHRDAACRVNRRRRSQVGELVPRLYTSAGAPCIRCGNCREMLTVSGFMTHVHWRHGSEKLVRITAAQKLQLQSSARAPENVAAWEAFQKKRAQFEGVPQTDETAASSRKDKPPKAAPEPDVKNTPDTSSEVLSTRHSSRVLKRKQLTSVEKHILAKAQSNPEVTAPDPKKLRRSTETLSPATTNHHHHSPVAPAVVSLSGLGQQHEKIPLANGTKRRRSDSQRRRPIVQSDRLLRVTANRSIDSRQDL